MTRSDLIAEILVTLDMYETTPEAKEAIVSAFREEFPYWNFSDWDQQIPPNIVKSLEFRASLMVNPTLQYLVKEFDRLLDGMHA